MTATPEKAITRIHVEGFRSLRSVDLDPGRITVLIGANGSGKSNLLSVLRMLALMRTRSLKRFVGEAGGASFLLHFGPAVTKEIALRLEFRQDTGVNAYAARLGYAARDQLLFLDETAEFQAPGTTGFSAFSLGAGHFESRLEDEAQNPAAATARTVRWWLSRMNFFHVHDTSPTSPLRQNAKQTDDRFLRSDGSNLAAFLRRLAHSEAPEDVAAWKRIGMLVRQVAPFVKHLAPELVDPAHPDTSGVRLAWVDDRDHAFGVHDFSDGTLRSIALVTALAQPTSGLPAFLSIDEPELGLHPAALGVLAGLAKSVAGRCQILLATQSPALLDHFEPEDVVVAERVGGATTLERLDAGRLGTWLEDYTLSELYDKNLLGGRP
jgi:predicted ATPase